MADEEYVVGSNENTISIAKDKGFFWRTLWDKNPELKSLRKNPNVLLAGDIMKIPELQPAEFSRGSDARHKFKRKGEPVKIKLKLLVLDEPRANEDYTLVVEGKQIKGKTNAKGELEQYIPGNAKSGTLILDNGNEEYPMRIGELDPVETISGVQQRLNNLGYGCGTSGEMDETTEKALKEFQAKYQLEVSGEADAATKAKLLELHQ